MSKLKFNLPPILIPAKAGIPSAARALSIAGIPAFAGMTLFLCLYPDKLPLMHIARVLLQRAAFVVFLDLVAAFAAGDVQGLLGVVDGVVGAFAL
jgi:hypothetical protein